MSASQPRLLFLNNQGLSSVGGGASLLRHLVSACADRYDVTVCSHDAPSVVGRKNVREVTIPGPPPTHSWRLAPLLRARHLRSVISEEILQGNLVVIALDCHFAPLLRHARAKAKIYVSLSCIPRQEWFGTPDLQTKLLRFLQYVHLERGAVKAADAVVVSSNVHAAEMRRFEGLRCTPLTVIYPAFPASPPSPASPRKSDVVTLVSAGRVEGVKNYSALVNLAQRTRDLPCRFLLAGDGRELSTLQEQVRFAGLQGRVVFLGPLPDIRSLLGEADLFLHPSHYESFGMSVLEAMLAGVPPICARDAIAGFREFTRDGIDSCYVDFEQIDEAASVVRRLITDPARRAVMGTAARQAALRLTTVDYVSRFFALVDEALATRGQSS